jgi:large subunit ribosomal protein L23
MSDKTVTLRPRLNEKTYGLADSRVYVFDVERDVNKHGIARAVEAQFEVKVVSVNTTNIGGKAKRIVSITGKRMKNAEGNRSDIKKAYVTLAEGHSLPFFNAIEEEEQKEQAVQEKVDKAVAKQADKDAKKSAKASKPAKTEKPVTKVSKPTAKSADKTDEAAPTEPVAKKSHIPAWRGFRLPKKSRPQETEEDK